MYAHISTHKLLLAVSDGLQSCERVCVCVLVCVCNYCNSTAMWTLESPQGKIQHHHVFSPLTKHLCSPLCLPFPRYPSTVAHWIPTHTPWLSVISSLRLWKGASLSVIVTPRMPPVSLKHLGLLSKLDLNVVCVHCAISCKVCLASDSIYLQGTMAALCRVGLPLPLFPKEEIK